MLNNTNMLNPFSTILAILLLPLCCNFAAVQPMTTNTNATTTTALLLIDIQNDYFDGGANPLSGSDAASLNAQKLLARFRANSLPIVHIQHHATRPGSTFFVPNTKGAEIHPNVAPLATATEKLITKHYPNSFRETGLLAHLKTQNITRLVICGMMTHVCVDATVRAAKDHGFDITLISDACATRNLEIQGQPVAAPEVQKSFLAALAYFYATVQTTAEYLK